jgi:hypothetical protein
MNKKEIIFNLERFKEEMIDDQEDISYPNCSKWEEIESGHWLDFETKQLKYYMKWRNSREEEVDMDFDPEHNLSFEIREDRETEARSKQEGGE